MLYKVSVLKQAELDIDNAYIWYELQQKGLGNIFFSSLNKAVTFISHNPLNCRAYYKKCKTHYHKQISLWHLLQRQFNRERNSNNRCYPF